MAATILTRFQLNGVIERVRNTVCPEQHSPVSAADMLRSCVDILPLEITAKLEIALHQAMPFMPPDFTPDVLATTNKNVPSVSHLDLVCVCMHYAMECSDYAMVAALIYTVDRALYRFGRSKPLLQTVRDLRRLSPGTSVAPQVTLRRARVLKDEGDLNGALKTIHTIISREDGWQYKDERQYLDTKAACLHVQGQIYHNLELWHYAIAPLVEGFRIFHQVQDWKGIGSCLHVLSRCLCRLEQSQYDQFRSQHPDVFLEEHPCYEGYRHGQQAVDNVQHIHDRFFVAKHQLAADESLLMFAVQIACPVQFQQFLLKILVEVRTSLAGHRTVHNLQNVESFVEFVRAVFLASLVLFEPSSAVDRKIALVLEELSVSLYGVMCHRDSGQTQTTSLTHTADSIGLMNNAMVILGLPPLADAGDCLDTHSVDGIAPEKLAEIPVKAPEIADTQSVEIVPQKLAEIPEEAVESAHTHYVGRAPEKLAEIPLRATKEENERGTEGSRLHPSSDSHSSPKASHAAADGKERGGIDQNEGLNQEELLVSYNFEKTDVINHHICQSEEHDLPKIVNAAIKNYTLSSKSADAENDTSHELSVSDLRVTDTANDTSHELSVSDLRVTDTANDTSHELSVSDLRVTDTASDTSPEQVISNLCISDSAIGGSPEPPISDLCVPDSANTTSAEPSITGLSAPGIVQPHGTQGLSSNVIAESPDRARTFPSALPSRRLRGHRRGGGYAGYSHNERYVGLAMSREELRAATWPALSLESQQSLYGEGDREGQGEGEGEEFASRRKEESLDALTMSTKPNRSVCHLPKTCDNGITNLACSIDKDGFPWTNLTPVSEHQRPETSTDQNTPASVSSSCGTDKKPVQTTHVCACCSPTSNTTSSTVDQNATTESSSPATAQMSDSCSNEHNEQNGQMLHLSDSKSLVWSLHVEHGQKQHVQYGQHVEHGQYVEQSQKLHVEHGKQLHMENGQEQQVEHDQQQYVQLRQQQQSVEDTLPMHTLQSPGDGLVRRAILYTFNAWTGQWYRQSTLVCQGDNLPLTQGNPKGAFRDAFFVQFLHQDEPLARYVGKKYRKRQRPSEVYMHDVTQQMMASYYVTLFNEALNKFQSEFLRIHFLPACHLQLVNSQGQVCDWFNVEPFMDGRYHKITNNAAHLSRRHDLARGVQVGTAFSHFSYVCSGGRHLVVDLQGCVPDDKDGVIYLTDPVLHTRDHRNGSIFDRHEQGMRDFWEHVHSHCNHFCRLLAIDGHRPCLTGTQ